MYTTTTNIYYYKNNFIIQNKLTFLLYDETELELAQQQINMKS